MSNKNVHIQEKILTTTQINLISDNNSKNNNNNYDENKNKNNNNENKINR